MTNHSHTNEDFAAPRPKAARPKAARPKVARPEAARPAASAGRSLLRCSVVCAIALVRFAISVPASAQGPDWMLPWGAKVLPSKAVEQSRPLPTRLPSVAPSSPETGSRHIAAAQPAKSSSPVENAELKKYPARLPVPRGKLTASPAAGSAGSKEMGPLTQAPARLLAPKAAAQIVTVPRESLRATAFDPKLFDRAIDASLAASRSPMFRPSVACESSVTAPSPPCNDASLYYDDFSPTPVNPASLADDSFREQWAYDAKRDVPTQHPWIEWGREFYGDGITPRGRNWFGEKNLARPKFYLYGDYRSGIATGRNQSGRIDNWANRLNLESDLQLTDTERFHAFVGPLDNGAQFSRWELVEGDLRYRSEIDLTPVTGFFEGDAGVLLGAAQDTTSPFELPVTIGLVPLLFQNGIWMEDAVTGAAFSLPARHSRLLNWSNFDATFFAVVDQLNSPAFQSEHAAQAFGTAWFIEAYNGYIESGYAYVRDRNFSELSYHNITTSYTRRYFDRISNSVRVIVNAGQDLPSADRTADGVLLLVENSWITQSPLTVVPYANFFVGWDRPQSVARAGVSGGILRNTGINFETDALNGYPTLDATGSDTAGGSVGIDLIGNDLNRQLLLEMSYLTPHGNGNPAVPGNQYAAGARYSVAISNWSLIRFDTMYGWRRGLQDVYGTRMEYRWKF